MFEFQKCMLAVLNMPQMKETIVASMQKFEVVGIITNSIEEFRKLYSDIEIPIYDYSDFYILKNKIIVIDVHWTIDTRRSFDEIMKKYKFCLADDYIYYSMLQSKINTNDIFELSDRNPFQFKKIIQKIIGKRKIVVVHGNCQTHAISNMLAGNKEFSDNYITIVMPRIWEEDQCIVMEQLLKSDILKMADYLFTQEISQDNRHSPKYASNYLKTLVPESCEIIMISNLFFLGYFPQYWKMKYPVGINLFHGKIMDATEYTDINVLRLILDNKSDEEILKTISSSEFYSQQELISGIENELKKFKKREHEQKIEIMMHDYLQDNYKKFLLFATSNHPTRDVLKELTQRILRRLKVNDLEISCPDDEIQSPMPTDWKYIIYPCVLKHLGIKRIMEYRFQAFFTSNELNCILGGDIFQYQAFPTENADQYFIEVKGDFETYMKIYIRCLRAAIMLLYNNKRSNEMKCLLVIPPYNERNSPIFFYIMPMGMAYINTAMRQAGLDVTCINLNNYEYDKSFDVLASKITTDNIECVLCGALSGSWRILKKVFSIAKAANPNIITIGGGGAYTAEPFPTAKLTDVDYAVIGEGEITDVELVQTLISKGDVSKVKGILYKENGIYKQTPPREEIQDLDTIAFPSYEDFDMEIYLDNQNLSNGYYLNKLDNPRAISMILGRSCPYHCKFCFHPSGAKYRIRSLDNFFEELDFVMEKYQPNCILVLDELFSAKVERIYEFCERIKPYHLNWLCQMRVDIVTKELLQTMKDAGCHSICYGLESHSETVLKNMRKYIDIEEIDRALEVTYDVGVDIEANFIFGDELEDMHTFYETMSWWFKNQKYGIHLLMIETYPGTGYYEELVKNGTITDKEQFLQDTNFLVNLTKDPVFWQKITVVISILNMYFIEELRGEILDLYENPDKK